MPFLDSYNYSLFSIPATYLLGMATHISAVRLAANSSELPNFDNTAPRQCLARIQALADKSAARLHSLALLLPRPRTHTLLPSAVYRSSTSRRTAQSTPACAPSSGSRVSPPPLPSSTLPLVLRLTRAPRTLAGSVIALSLFVKSSTALNKALY